MWSSMWDTSSEKHGDLKAALTIFAIIMTTVSFWFLQTWNKHSRNSKPAPLPPGPHGVPLLGYLPFLGTNHHHQFTDLSRVYGPIYRIQLGTKLVIVVSSPSLVKEVVRDQDTIFFYRNVKVAQRILSYGGSDIVFGTHGPEWRKMRKMLASQMLSKTNLDDCYALRKQEVVKSIRHVYNEKIGTPIDFGQFVMSTTSNTFSCMLWGGTLQGEKASDVGSEFRKVVMEMIWLLQKPNVSDFFPVLARFDIQGIRSRAKKLQSVTENMFDSIIETQMNKDKNEGVPKKHEGKGFLQFLLENNINQDSATSLTMKQVKALLTDIVVAGNDTTAGIIEWAMSELIQHPDELRKVQEELTKIVGINNLVEEFHLPKLHYLDAVIKETFRLHPVLPLLAPRCSSQSTTIGGYYIPKGSIVFLNAWAIHRDSSVWDDPLEFRPWRFLNTDTSNSFGYQGNNFHYLPFGSGRRICPGIPLAKRILVYVLASFLHSFEWTLPNDATVDLSDKFGIVTKKKAPLIVVPTPRLSNLELYA
ncbi:labd-13Z-ene-9,15,16-triol synthase, chloroplastic-like [Rosa rugosa]|uniref:labd-13Z-ene-9,15,16-triol synthase, chloroplastic-like n=1 Tax=Rosa rugosa TaxID=74645 RepID=UPI002B409E04|nr:labd-13Z-ene-9,15,16-triol synthase, chloroplastic-like [Rosa rugosa]